MIYNVLLEFYDMASNSDDLLTDSNKNSTNHLILVRAARGRVLELQSKLKIFENNCGRELKSVFARPNNRFFERFFGQIFYEIF